MHRLPHIPRWSLGLVLLLTVALSGLGVPAPAHAQFVTLTGNVESTDPGPILTRLREVPPGYSPYLATVYITYEGKYVEWAGLEADGSFSVPIRYLPNLLYPPTSFTLQVEAGDALHYSHLVDVQLTCSYATGSFICDPVAPLLIRQASMYGNIEGTVRDKEGQPVAGAYVLAGVASARTDATGYYRMAPLYPDYPMFGWAISVPEGRPGEYDVIASGDSYLSDPVTERVTVPGGEITRADFVIERPLPPQNRPYETAQGLQECQVGKPITVTTGNMLTQQEDLAYPSAFGRFSFTRTYNSQATYAGSLGLGWSHPYEYELKQLHRKIIRVRNAAGNIRFYDLADEATKTYRVGAPAREAAVLVKHDAGYTETEADGLTREYNTAGQLLTIRTRAGWQTTLTYSTDGLASVTDPGGRSLTFTYSAGKLSRVEGPGGLFASYTYDAQGRLVTVTDAQGVRWSYTWSEPGNIIVVQSPAGVGRHAVRAPARALRLVGAPLTGGEDEADAPGFTGASTPEADRWPRLIRASWTPPRPARPADPLAPARPANRPARGKALLAQVSDTGSDSFPPSELGGLLASVRDANGHLVEEHAYDYNGRVIATRQAEGVKALTLAYLGGITTQVTDSLGGVTTYTYGTFGDQPQVTQVQGPCACGAADLTMEYDAQGRRIAETDARGHTTRFTYDAQGNLLTRTDALGQVTTWTYNAFGQILTTTDPLGATTTFTYDDSTGFLLQVTDALGGSTRFTPTAANLPGTVTDPRGNSTSLVYDAAGLILSRTDPTGATTTFSYDPAGRLLTTTDALGGGRPG